MPIFSPFLRRPFTLRAGPAVLPVERPFGILQRLCWICKLCDSFHRKPIGWIRLGAGDYFHKDA